MDKLGEIGNHRKSRDSRTKRIHQFLHLLTSYGALRGAPRGAFPLGVACPMSDDRILKWK
jgi:hypothetical protein